VGIVLALWSSDPAAGDVSMGAPRSQGDGTPTARRMRASKVRSGSTSWRKIRGLAPKPTA
jgi:hypothetical protein